MEEEIVFKPIETMGMHLTQATYKSCTANIGLGKDWATIYSISSSDEGKGHCQELCKYLKEFYTECGKVFGSTVALSSSMKHILQKLEITEYD